MSVSNFIPNDGSLWSIRAVDISGNYNQKLNFDASGNAIIGTGNTDRLTINSSGAWTCQGGMTYNNATNTLTAGTFSGSVSGNATSATNISGGAGGSIPYQSAASTTAFLANGSNGQFLKSLGGTNPPLWDSLPVASTPTLSQVLVEGNSAGATNIDMNTRNITNATSITATTFTGNFIPTSETISGTTAISTTIPVTFISGTTHSLASGTTIGQTKTIIKSSANVVSTLGFTSTTASTGSQTISALRYDPVLNRMYVGGAFATIGGVANTVGIAFWNFTTSTWNAMGTGTQAGNLTYDIQIIGTRVYCTGEWLLAGGVANTARIAYWDTGTNSWNAMGTGLTAQGNKMLATGGANLYVCGNFGTAGGVANTARIALWNGAAWSALGTGIITGVASGLALVGTSVWVSGSFSAAGGVANTQYLARWDGAAWNGYGANQLTGGAVNTIQTLAANTLFVSGQFTSIGTTPTFYSASLNTSTNTFTAYGSTSNTSTQRSYIDTDGLLWYLSSNSSLGAPTSQNPASSQYYNYAQMVSYYDTGTSKFVPLFTISGNNPQGFAIERTNVAGVYWIGGIINELDGVITGANGVVSFNKNEWVRGQTSSALIVNGLTRSNFSLLYKGQSVNLINIDNASWVVTGTSLSTVGYSGGSVSGGAPQVIFS